MLKKIAIARLLKVAILMCHTCKMIAMKPRYIDTDSEARIALLKEMISKHRSAAAFAREYKLNEAHISQILTGKRGFGFRVAANMGMKIAGNPVLFERTADQHAHIAIEPQASMTDRREVERRDLTAYPEVAKKLLEAFSRMSEADQKRMLLDAEYKAGLADLERDLSIPKLKHAG